MRIIENGLIPVMENDNGNKLVDGRELYEFLEIKKDFTDWFKYRVEQYGFIEDEDFTTILGKSTGGRPSKNYILTLDTAKELSMVENNSKGSEARKYFIAVEKKYKQVVNKLSMEDIMITTLQEMKSVKLEISSTVQKVEELDNKVETQITLSFNQAKNIQSSIGARVIELFGGKDSEDYKIYSKTYFSAIHRELKKKFGVPSYRDILKRDYANALKFIDTWIPDADIRIA